jgi:hypothetical protein
VTSTIVAAGLAAALIVIALAFLWQERRTRPEPVVVYGVEDAIDWVMPHLSPATASRLGRDDVRRILAWEMRYVQDPDLRSADDVVVVGGLEAAEYTQRRAVAEGHPYDGDMIIEVLDLKAGYLAAIGAVGDPVGAEETRRVIDRWAHPDDAAGGTPS